MKQISKNEEYIEKAEKLFRKLLAKDTNVKITSENKLPADFFNYISVLSFNYTIPFNYVAKYSNVHGVLW